MRFSIGDKVIVSDVPEIKRKLRGKKGEVVDIHNGDVNVKINSSKHPQEEYGFYPNTLRMHDEPFGSNETERRAKYLKSSGVKCPFCDSMDISAGHLEGDAGTAWTDVECRDCKREWRETYELVHYEEKGEIPASHEIIAKPDQKVVIEVDRGVADVTQCPKNVDVEIIDHDNRDEKEIGQ